MCQLMLGVKSEKTSCRKFCQSGLFAIHLLDISPVTSLVQCCISDYAVQYFQQKTIQSL